MLIRVPKRLGPPVTASDNRDECDRARRALQVASEGHDVAVGPAEIPGFALAPAVFEAIETARQLANSGTSHVPPGVSA